MKCASCEVDKLSKEFPADVISRKCFHIPSFCLKCLVNHFNVRDPDLTQQKCPECSVIVSKREIEDLSLEWEKALFRINIKSVSVFKKKGLHNNDDIDNNIDIAKGNFYVVLLNGTKLNFTLEKIKSVEELKIAIEKRTYVKVSKQKLSYKGVELETFSDQGNKNQLSDYSIVVGCHIQLMVLLYSISKEYSISSLTFDLFWGYPSNGRDYLDGTCMLYAGGSHYRTFDWSKKSYGDLPDISHSGDIMDNINKKGHHRITANLASMPSNVTRLYFILSAYNSPNIGCFPSPTFKMFDPSDPDIQLCSYTIQSAAVSQAVIMCVVEKKDEDDWNVFEIGRLSDGNAKYYQPIMNSISSINQFE